MAPAGGPEAACAALHYGADAVYFGLRQFSARADAVNFSPEEADAVTAYAHSLSPRRKVFAAVNTLVLQDELPGLVEQAAFLADIGVDAVIVQDLGAYRLLRRHFPKLHLHASTQMAAHNLAGVLALKELGFSRITLARELTLDEIRGINRAAGVETETFVHGALCYSYSGLCLFSSHAVGRSGNRGRCAYMCRDDFAADRKEGGFLFSMKDLALPGDVEALRDAGVASFKIEGRMKSPLYVAATVNYYRKLIDGTLSPADRKRCEEDIRSIFSRPWTSLYVHPQPPAAVVDQETVGHRGTPIGKVETVLRGRSGPARLHFTTSRALEVHDGLQIDIPGSPRPFGFAVDDLRIVGRAGPPARPLFEAPAGSAVEVGLPDDAPAIPKGALVYCSSSQDVKRRYRFDMPKPGAFRVRRPLAVQVELDERGIRVRASAEGETAEGNLPGPFKPARNARQMEQTARGAFEKLGDTPFGLAGFELRNPSGLFVPVSQLNNLRRQVTVGLQKRLADMLAQRIRQVQADTCHPQSAIGNRQSTMRWSLKVDRIAHLDAFVSNDWKDLDEVVVDIAVDPLEVLQAKLGALPLDRVRLALPPITRSWEEDVVQKIGALQSAGWQKWEAANVSAWHFLAPGIDLSTDWSVYVTNRLAALQVLEMGASRFTLSPEDGLANMRSLLEEFGPKATVIVYQDTPLFVSETRVEQAEMTSSHGDRVLALDCRGRTVVISRRPFCLASRLNELKDAGAVSVRADFVFRPYRPEEVRDLWRSLRGGGKPDGHLGNFDRGLL